MTEYYPLVLRSIAHAKVWGGRNLQKLLAKTLPPDQLIGETWEAWDGCVVENGVHAGTTLRDLIAQETAGVLGANARNERFPLLFKFIDAQGDLSVQVHPNDQQAAAMEHYPFGKTEAWYIIDAEPKAALIHGFKNDVDENRIKELLAQNRLQDELCYVPITRGDVVFVPAGTVHAITRGIVLAEIQENSDITYRLYDWGRIGEGRELHVEQSLRVAKRARAGDHKIPRLTIEREGSDQHFLVTCRYFSYELFDLRSPTLVEFNKFNMLSFVTGAADVSYGPGLGDSLRAKRGQTLILPAGLARVKIAPSEMPCQMLRAYVPDLREDVIAPLTHADFSKEDIIRLGGSDPAANDLARLLE